MDKLETKKLSSGSAILDNLLTGGFECDIVTTIYGPSGSGKTNICMSCAIHAVKNNKNVIYVDCEGGFSVERMKQFTPEFRDLIKKITFFKPTTFEEQKRVFEELNKLVNSQLNSQQDPQHQQISLIIIDTISMLYRLELGKTEEVYNINRELGQQIGYLTAIARKKNIPILITNQVYANFEEKEKINMVGGDILRYGSKCLIELQRGKNGVRTAIIKKHRSKPEDEQVMFRIADKGLFGIDDEPISQEKRIDDKTGNKPPNNPSF